MRSMSPRLGGERAVASKALGSPMSSNFTFKMVLPKGQRCKNKTERQENPQLSHPHAGATQKRSDAKGARRERA